MKQAARDGRGLVGDADHLDDHCQGFARRAPSTLMPATDRDGAETVRAIATAGSPAFVARCRRVGGVIDADACPGRDGRFGMRVDSR
jgi:hypothetical protein